MAKTVKAAKKEIKHPIFRRFIKRPSTIIGSIILLVFFFGAIFGPMIIKGDPIAQDLKNVYAAPSAEHWFGTDNLGRDTWTRMIYGARTSLLVSFVAVAIGSVVGITIGLCAGYFGGWTDTILSRFIDILLAFPGLLLAIMIVSILGTGLFNTIIAISFYSIPGMARRTRGLVINIKKREFVQACHIFGAKSGRIIMTHIFPNCISLIIVDVTLALGNAILTSSALSFLGLGVQPPNAEWGAMMNEARNVIRMTALPSIIPGVAISLVVLSFSMVGDGLRDALDPRLKNS